MRFRPPRAQPPLGSPRHAAQHWSTSRWPSPSANPPIRTSPGPCTSSTATATRSSTTSANNLRRPDDAGILPHVFERFTDGARQVIVHAQEAARQLNHNYIGTEHILLGLLWDSAEMSAEVLSSFGLTVETVMQKVVELVGRGEGSLAGQVPFTPAAKKTLELSLREALALGHNTIWSGHLLLGQLRVEEGVAMRILLDAGIPLEEVRTQLVERLAALAPEDVRGPVSPRTVPPSNFGFSVEPDAQLRRLLMAAGGLALSQDRQEISLADLVAVLRAVPEARRLLDAGPE